MTISSTLPPPDDGRPKPLTYGIPYIRLDPEDMTAIEAMIRREVRAALQIIEDDPTPNIISGKEVNL